MKKKHEDPIIKCKENTTYSLFIFFLCIFLVKLVFGIITNSSALIVSGIMALIGVIASIIILLRISGTLSSTKEKIQNFNNIKFEFFIIAGASLIIAIGAASVFFLSVHLVFYHTIYPPDLMAAWLSTILAALNWLFVLLMRSKLLLIDDPALKTIESLLEKDFILSVMVIMAVVISRSGLFSVDYLLAVVTAVLVVFYCIYFLHNSLRGLMGNSCDLKTFSEISGYLENMDENLNIENLKITPNGTRLEIMATINVSKDTKIKEAKLIVTKIRKKLKDKLSVMHDAHIGFRSEIRDD